MRFAAITDGVAKLLIRRDRGAKSTKRALVHEILSIQVMSAALIGVLAIVGLYWGGQWVLRDNYSRWALQWTEQLNDLGSPLYLTDSHESRIGLDSFVEALCLVVLLRAGEGLSRGLNRDLQKQRDDPGHLKAAAPRRR